MANDKLLKELDVLSNAYDNYENELKCKKEIDDFLINMPVEPVKTEKPKILFEYELQPTAFTLKTIDEMSRFIYKKMPAPPSFSKIKHGIFTFGWVLLFGPTILVIVALINIFTAKDATFYKVYLIIVAIVIVCLLVARIIYGRVYLKHKRKAYDEYVEETKKYNESISSKVKEYNEETKKYNIACEKYKEAKEAYGIEYNRLYKIAEEECAKYNELIEIIARKKFDTVLASLSFDYPPNYYYAISDIRSIIKESRANYVSAAIIIYKQDREEEERIYSERRARKAIEEQEQALKRKEYEEEERIRQLRANCCECIHFFRCNVIKTLTSVCPLFRQR